MGLQYYDINIGLTSTQEVAAQGRYIYYFAGSTPLIDGGVTPAAAGNQAIKVQAGSSGNTLILMPGQSYRLPAGDKAPSVWKVTNAKGAEKITGQVLIGEGDFHDSNISNTIKLDATFANTVEVTNTPGKRIPVTLDTAQIITTAGNVMTYTASYSSGVPGVGGPITLLPPATNVNGVIVNAFDYVGQPPGNFVFTVLAKASLPTGPADGEVIFSGMSAVSVLTSFSMQRAVKVAAGKGVYFYCAQADNAAVRSALFTVL